MNKQRGVPSKRVLGGVGFEHVGSDAAVAMVVSAIQARTGKVFAFCNMHTFNLVQRTPALRSAMSRFTVFNDGVGMDIASRFLHGSAFPSNLNGTDLTPAVLGRLAGPTNVYLVGGTPGVAEKAGRVLEANFPLVSVVGSHDGYFSPEKAANLVEAIRGARTDLLLLGMGNPRQELWADEIRVNTGAVIMCVGAFLDFTAGQFPRAPRVVRAMRLEWLFRLGLEPARMWRRYVNGAGALARTLVAEKSRMRAQRARREPVSAVFGRNE